jgi:ribosome-binding factor A
MGQRVAKIESLIQAVVATRLRELLEGDAAVVTVTRVDAAPDLRNATVWIGLLGNEAQRVAVWGEIDRGRGEVQAALAARLTTKFVPHLTFKQDTGGEYAAEIDRLLKGL